MPPVPQIEPSDPRVMVKPKPSVFSICKRHPRQQTPSIQRTTRRCVRPEVSFALEPALPTATTRPRPHPHLRLIRHDTEQERPGPLRPLPTRVVVDQIHERIGNHISRLTRTEQRRREPHQIIDPLLVGLAHGEVVHISMLPPTPHPGDNNIRSHPNISRRVSAARRPAVIGMAGARVSHNARAADATEPANTAGTATISGTG